MKGRHLKRYEETIKRIVIEKTKESFPNCMPSIKVPIYTDKRNKNSKKQEKKKYSKNKSRKRN